jgi:tRNA G46 methylase TrmB
LFGRHACLVDMLVWSTGVGSLMSDREDMDDGRDIWNIHVDEEDEALNDKDHLSRDDRKYLGKKPLWWRRQSGRKISKRQRQAIREMQQLGYQLQSPKIIKSSLSVRPMTEMLLWDLVFPNRISPDGITRAQSEIEIWLELGFGLGDNLLCMTSLQENDRERKRCFVGAEIHSGGIGTLCTRMSSAIQNRRYWTDYTLFSPNITSRTVPREANHLLYDNLRIFMGDGVKLLNSIPDGSISVVLVAFPDPFMGTNQSSYRLLQADVLHQIRRILSPTPLSISDSDLVAPGRLYLATDHEGYHKWSHEQVDQLNRLSLLNQRRDVDSEASAGYIVASSGESMPSGSLQLLVPTPHRSLWLPVISKYEQKGVAAGRRTWLSCWEAR